MIRLLLESEADCLTRQHTEPRGRPLVNRHAWPEPPTAQAVSCTPVMACHLQGESPCRSWPQLRS
jgi:hypothetical protein